MFCAGNSERRARRITQHPVSMRNDGWTRCIDATLYIKELLATPVAAVLPDLACEDKRAGCERAALRVFARIPGIAASLTRARHFWARIQYLRRIEWGKGHGCHAGPSPLTPSASSFTRLPITSATSCGPGNPQGSRTVVADQPQGEADQARRQGGQPWPLRDVPDGRSCRVGRGSRRS